MPTQGARLAVDIGGTFTDVVVEVAGRHVTAKVLTTPAAPEQGVCAGIEDALARAGVTAGAVELVLHGTTLATNAILERKGAVTALVTTAGFRDVLDIGYESRYDQYDLGLQKPTPLVPRYRRLSVPERVDVAGRVLQPLDEAASAELVTELDRLAVESVAVGFLHAYANPGHERRVREMLQERLPHLAVTLSSEVCPEVREYERLSTAVANAYVQPLMARYLNRLGAELQQLGLHCPLLLMTSGGGLTTLETAIRFPIRLVESGPAGGAILAGGLATELGLPKLISFDMGGTTAKICLLEDGHPQTAREFEVDRAARFRKGSGLPLRIPVIEMVEIGAGGGSVARLDALGRVAVGPDSAGADPGPAAYGRGGERPTVTDADLLLGRIDPDYFAGGKVKLAPGLAALAVDRDVGQPLGLDTTTAAYGVVEMVDETMANAARVHAVERGRAAADHALVAFGGAAPLHVCRLAEKLRVERIVVPVNAGVGSAVGFLRAPIRFELVRSRHMLLRALDAAAINDLFAEMRAEALEVVRAGAPQAGLSETRAAYMRYFGQGHEILVPLPVRPLTAADSATLQTAFDAHYQQLYRRVIPDCEVEVLTWTLSLAVELEPPTPPAAPAAPMTTPPQPLGKRRLVDSEAAREIEAALYRRADLRPGDRLDGPAVIAEEATSTFVSRHFSATVTAGGHLLLQRNPVN